MYSYRVLVSLLLVLHPLSALRGAEEEQKTIAVLGSSVAAGWVTSYEAKHDLQNGYAARLGRLLQGRGYSLVNISVPGNSTADVLARMDRDLDACDPDFVLIGLSLGNENLVEEPETAVENYRQNLPLIIDRCRDAGRIPVVGLCYPYDGYDAEDYAAIRSMNLEIESWGVPTINLLGAVDDGNGHFVEGYTFDEGHPDNRGHEEMFLAVVPSLFDALVAGKPAPERPEQSHHTTIVAGTHPAPLCLVPEDPIHSFSFGFSLRTEDVGTVAAVQGASAPAELFVDGEGCVGLRSTRGELLNSYVEVTDGDWHDVLLCQRFLQQRLLLFVDGELAGTLEDQLAPRRFILGGSDREERQAPREADYRNWLVYRAAHSPDEALELYGGALLSGSLELYSPLFDEQLSAGTPVKNLAQSTATAWALPGALRAELTRLEERIAAAAEARENEFVVEETPVVEVSREILETYVGKYEIAPGDQIEIALADQKLQMIDRGQPIELFAESEVRFFIKTAGDLTITFEKNDAGQVTRLVIGAGGREIPAARVE